MDGTKGERVDVKKAFWIQKDCFDVLPREQTKRKTSGEMDVLANIQEGHLTKGGRNDMIFLEIRK